MVAVDRNSAVFSTNLPYSCAEMAFAGASCPASSPPGTGEIQTLQISVPTGDPAIVALKVRTKTNEGKRVGLTTQDSFFIIKAVWREGKLIVDLEELFVPPADRLVGLDGNLDIRVTTGGQVFTTCRNQWASPESLAFREKKETCLASGCRIVNNPNLLLRFAVGQTTLDDLEAAATLDHRSQTERELGQVKAEIEKLRLELANAEVVYKKHLTQLAQAQGDLSRSSLKLVKADEQIGALDLKLADMSRRCENSERELAGRKCQLTEMERELADRTDSLKELALKLQACRAKSQQQHEDLATIRHILFNCHDPRTMFSFLPWVKVKKLKALAVEIFNRG